MGRDGAQAVAQRPLTGLLLTERERYFAYLEQGVDGDLAAEMAAEDELQAQLARFIAAQPAHNSPIPYIEEGEDV